MTRHGLGPPQLSLKEDPARSAIRGDPDLYNRVLRDLYKKTFSQRIESCRLFSPVWLTYWALKRRVKDTGK